MNSATIPSQSSAAGDGIDQIAASVRSGQVVLFLGAGVHASKPALPGQPEPPPDPRRPLFAGALAEALAQESRWTERFPNKPPKDYFQRVALDYELSIILDEQWKDWAQQGKSQGLAQPPARPGSATEASDLRHRGRARLGKCCAARSYCWQDTFPGIARSGRTQFSPGHHDKLRPPFRRCLADGRKKPNHSSLPGHRNRSPQGFSQDPSPHNPFIFKIHGDINTPESLVITDEDYIDFVLRMTVRGDYDPVPETFQFRLVKWPTLFIGYSLLDYNLRLLLKTFRYKKDRSHLLIRSIPGPIRSWPGCGIRSSAMSAFSRTTFGNLCPNFIGG